MESKDLLKRQELAEEIGMKFDEVAELFSEETLCTMQMVKFRGGKGINVNPACDTKLSCSNGVCSDTNVILCGLRFFCSDDAVTTQPPTDPLKWEGCPTSEPPTPPTVQQDAICWQKPPLPPITTS